MNRRGTLKAVTAGAVAAVAAPMAIEGAQAVIGADAALIALCARFDALERQRLALYPGGATPIIDDNERDAVIVPIGEAQENLLDQIAEQRAVTLAGFRALAASLDLWDTELADPQDSYACFSERLVGMLVRDLGRLA